MVPRAMDKRGKDWTSLTEEQENTLVDLVVDQLGREFSKSKFVDFVHSLLDSIAGFEVASQSRKRSLIDKLWRRAMFLRRQEKADERVVVQDVTGYQLAVNEGKKLIGEGKTKSQAAMSIYNALQSTDKETVVKAFVEGASLTEKGAMTYWYNCKRKQSKTATE
jgi:hypothetical protein